MTTKLLRRREVESMLGVSRAWIYRKMKDGAFPRPVHVGSGPSGAVRWDRDAVEKWLDGRRESAAA